MSRWLSLVAVIALVGAGIAAVIVGRNGLENGPGTVTPDTTPVDVSDPSDPADPADVTDPVDPDTSDTPDTDGSDTDGPDTDPTDPVDVTDPVEPPALEPSWSYYPPGDLEKDTGDGAATLTVFAPEMVFPVREAPAYPQSQVYRPGGQVPGDQCQESNYQYPWRDNFCETRTSKWSTPYCTEDGVHLGQDIRAGTPAGCQQMRGQSPAERGLYAIVAAEDGYVSNVGSYTVNVRAGGRIYRYLHMNMARLQVSLGDKVTAGQVLGYLSNDFGGVPTTFHLHFEIKMNTAEHGWTFVPPYLSLVEAYARREANPGEMIRAVDSDDPVVIGASAEP
jgi:hypothetical protein